MMTGWMTETDGEIVVVTLSAQLIAMRNDDATTLLIKDRCLHMVNKAADEQMETHRFMSKKNDDERIHFRLFN
ncbi:unnamed protein product [Anisakis simplex]|uniref:Signal transduction histidine kinase n=1 Tax=Anisakis simplex TaxID=6269 RepID=A0A0M3JZU5_ANISI|nr:unnamed protein product [Anisakis simplex]